VFYGRGIQQKFDLFHLSAKKKEKKERKKEIFNKV
jgi:hypothetical protein